MTTTIQAEERANPSVQWLEELSNPEIQEALITLIHKLPQLKNAVLKMEQGVEVMTTAVADPDTIDHFTEPINQVARLVLNKETLKALESIMEKMPRIAKSVELLDQFTPFIEFMTKRETLVSIAEVVELVTDPVTDRAKEGMSIVKEAQRRAEIDHSTISIFGLLRLLKDPAVQKGLRFVHAFLEILQERKIVK